MYIVGDTIDITWTVLNSSGVAADPTEVTLDVETPAGTKTTYTYSLGEITKSSTGVYTKAISLASAGLWRFEFQGTGAVAKVENKKIRVSAQII